VGDTVFVGIVYRIRSPDFITHCIRMDGLAETPFSKSCKYRDFSSVVYFPFSGFGDMVYLIFSLHRKGEP
jgi:hypothetical protein